MGEQNDDRDWLVKAFAYEYVSFNHDLSRAYLCTNVTDDCMLELEGMAGLYAPSCFQKANKSAVRLIHPTAGADGRYCVHHDDDPAHGPVCYEAVAMWDSDAGAE